MKRGAGSRSGEKPGHHPRGPYARRKGATDWVPASASKLPPRPNHPLAMERAAEPYHKAMDDAAARLSRFFLIAGGTSFSGLMAFMATFSVFRGADSLVDLLFAIVLAMVSTAMLIGCTAWAVILLTGAMNALILASEEEPPARPPYLLRWAFWLVGKGKPKIWMTFFAFALSAIIVFALVTAWPVFIAMVDDWLAALL